MNYAIIFAGGVGKRMKNGALPKQFLELHGKPIIIYTLERFEESPEIDGMVVVCVSGWQDYLQKKIDLFGLKKVKKILTGGKEAIDSQYNGVKYVYENLDHDADTVVLLHDGVRPLIDQKTIRDNVEKAQAEGNAITTVPAIETVGIVDDTRNLSKFVDRSKCVMARAPQTYKLDELVRIFHKFHEDNSKFFVDSATMMQHYGVQLHTVVGSPNNIKITTPTDFFIFRAIMDAQENSQIFGISGDSQLMS